jgi:glutamate synthase domain-containing protein 3
MSFGAISAEAQRDIILAMRQIGGRSNSGEGGENPYYFTEGITASIKQVASGRFGVTATYLVTGNEIQIKIAQGAKPGEGGQLMAAKVNEDIAKARFSKPNVDLISPPPMHDIYSIEDLKQLIFELKQVNPTAKVSVKLVSGTHIGTIALGVAKAGADVIHISGTDGGTGAASLSSMKHAGLPFEFGLLEVHHTLLANGLRNSVTLRTDGGLHTGKDIVMAALMGAEEYEFGRLLLVAEGCVMARICEKNTCPVGIATHNPRFKAKYKGTAEHIVTMLSYLAEDVRRWLAVLGATTLQEIIGKTELLQIAAQHRPLVNKRNLDLTAILQPNTPSLSQEKSINPFSDGVSNLNQRIIDKCKDAIEQNTDTFHSFNICTMDRATGATLSGLIAKRASDHFLSLLQPNSPTAPEPYTKTIHLHFKGSAGQGFGVFLTDHIYMRLEGEANDSVGKTMSGGKLIIIPDSSVSFAHENNVIIGNCAIYGATGGTLYVNGIAGDRFAVRNSGATAVVEGTGLHACEYMTNGLVVILGETDDNIGSGMTGGELITLGSRASKINAEYITEVQMQESDYEHLKALLDDYATETRSAKANEILENWDSYKNKFVKYLPVNVVAAQQATAPCVTEDETV